MSRDDWELLGFGAVLGFVLVVLIAYWTGVLT